METVRSQDGTRIAFTRSGQGPALVIVNGGLSDHRSSEPLLPYLEPHFTVYAFDRRGRGSSDQATPYAVDGEVEDIAALLSVAGAPVCLFGHSSGAILALDAALAGLPVTWLALSEPPFVVGGDRPPPPADLEQRLEALLAAGDQEGALTTFLREGMLLPEPAIEQIRATPQWPAWLALAQTLPADLRIAGEGRLPLDRLPALSVPTLVLQGGASPAWMRNGTATLAESLPNGRLAVLEGQGHDAARQTPRLMADELVRFVTGR
jgi:pimeloyl-ACP methyl ester carboxylesterase